MPVDFQKLVRQLSRFKGQVLFFIGAICILALAVRMLINGISEPKLVPSSFFDQTNPASSWVASETEETVSEEVSSQWSTIYVDIKGAVERPGVYELPSDSRVKDAIQAAGGLLSEADESQLNLAQRLSDQAVLLVLTKEQVADRLQQKESTNSTKQADEGMSSLAVGLNQQVETQEEELGVQGGLVNINTADSSALQTLPGIGEKKAQAIIDYRQSQGSFKQKEDLKEVKGIGDKTYKELEGLICVN
ncbi:ComEA family DNA-binding protein [Vaginisenegalia massiliensis]|uniref:ComEA family DNA-binding protein n=1 Tax=Vaginisenegalia massiliensis TaxID=2058294 RepID=UPI000F541C25|nr:ComEA family DNA-binding protein [Vaginisenegalia massiliensis]